MTAVDEDLAGVATAALADLEPEQGMLDGTDTLKVRFVGVQYDSLDLDLAIGQEMSFAVRGRIVGTGVEEKADGHRQRYAKLKVQSVTELDTGGVNS